MTKMTNKPTNTEQAIIRLMGQTIQFVWRSGAVKIFTICLIIIAVGFFAFSYRVPPTLAFGGLFLFCVGIVGFLMYLIQKAPELFQDSGTWFDYKQMMEGQKDTGLHLPSPQVKFVQPIIKTKTISAKANIVSTKQK